MEKNFIKLWDNHKRDLREKLSNMDITYSLNYKELVGMLISTVFNHDDNSYTNLRELDFGDYQGTLIFVFTKD